LLTLTNWQMKYLSKWVFFIAAVICADVLLRTPITWLLDLIFHFLELFTGVQIQRYSWISICQLAFRDFGGAYVSLYLASKILNIKSALIVGTSIIYAILIAVLIIYPIKYSELSIWTGFGETALLLGQLIGTGYAVYLMKENRHYTF
jgi:hypothetical protein